MCQVDNRPLQIADPAIRPMGTSFSQPGTRCATCPTRAVRVYPGEMQLTRTPRAVLHSAANDLVSCTTPALEALWPPGSAGG